LAEHLLSTDPLIIYGLGWDGLGWNGLGKLSNIEVRVIYEKAI